MTEPRHVGALPPRTASAASRGVVRVLAWVWTRALTERMRVATMWLLNEKVDVRVVAVVPGPGGSVLARARHGRWTLPSVRLERAMQPDAQAGAHLRATCGLAADAWVPVDAVRRRGARIDAVFVAAGARATGSRSDGRVAWVDHSLVDQADGGWAGMPADQAYQTGRAGMPADRPRQQSRFRGAGGLPPTADEGRAGMPADQAYRTGRAGMPADQAYRTGRAGMPADRSRHQSRIRGAGGLPPTDGGAAMPADHAGSVAAWLRAGQA